MHYVRLFFIILITLIFSGCKENSETNELHFATTAEYPPFEYSDRGELKGFDIELAKLIAKELGKKAVFDNMQFSTVLPVLTSGQDDIAIATISITDARKKNFDFSDPYYFEGMAAVYPANQPVTTSSQLKGKRVAVQLGSVMEIWMHENFPTLKIIALDNNNQAIEALLAGHVDVVLLDGTQGKIFTQNHAGLSYSLIAKADHGYALTLKKGSPLTAQINKALHKLKANGEIKKLENTWLNNS
ncbi:glutamine-binding periplasmic protein precursor [Legionella wadsworthii]|uniref:Glutamine-binding periplasmic protein n=1 Tax=Legionella wadsworthii TaxID=28088 RepID=A0A378LU28_9GAMM|nr:ABC transporter substrate-binding protein [Legionella wadsworthii]STY29850.1 glutamine-binding periplasmic protein precursor [Legionella wadsworthii]